MARQAIYPFGRVGSLAGAYKFPRSDAAIDLANSRLFEAGPVTGEISAIEDMDTVALSGDVLIFGALAGTEAGSDASAFAGDVIVSGGTATSEAPDTGSFAGNLLVTGQFAVTESGADTAAIGEPTAAPLAPAGNVKKRRPFKHAIPFAKEVLWPELYEEPKPKAPVKGRIEARESGQDGIRLSAAVRVRGVAVAREWGADGFSSEGHLYPRLPDPSPEAMHFLAELIFA